jgi:hypothetical protein
MSTPLDLSIPIERITWLDGQELASRDLRDSQANDDRFRSLHIHYQHKTWGVVEGLNVVAVGLSAAGVSPGYALDLAGGALLVPLSTTVPVPANIAATMYLVLSGNGESGCSCDDSPPPLCAAAEIEQGVLSWKTVNEVRPGIDVLLARALVAAGQLAGAIDTSIQLRAATMAQARIWSDQTLAGQTGWIDGNEAWVSNISAVVDTSDAGFVATPAYFAWLIQSSGVSEGFILKAGATSFTFVLREIVAPSAKFDAATANSQGWTVQWFAVELPPVALLFPFIPI